MVSSVVEINASLEEVISSVVKINSWIEEVISSVVEIDAPLEESISSLVRAPTMDVLPSASAAANPRRRP